MMAAWPMNARISLKLIATSMRLKLISTGSENSSKNYARAAMILSWRNRCFTPWKTSLRALEHHRDLILDRLGEC